jgi:hypothetical protein
MGIEGIWHLVGMWRLHAALLPVTVVAFLDSSSTYQWQCRLLISMHGIAFA